MKWNDEAEAAIKKVPFFVRKKVRARVENEAAEAGREIVSLDDVKATQRRFMKNMANELKGYQVDTCFSQGAGCPNQVIVGGNLPERLAKLFEEADILGFLKGEVKGGLKMHHEFRVSLADCPNGCSQPQIKDIGIVAAMRPAISEDPCTRCNACVEVCRESAVLLDGDADGPAIDFTRCLLCAQCVAACPSGTLAAGETGYTVMLGGKLGRHPRLARQLPGVFTEDEVVGIVSDSIGFFKQNSKNGKRFAAILTDSDLENMAKRYGR